MFRLYIEDSFSDHKIAQNREPLDHIIPASGYYIVKEVLDLLLHIIQLSKTNTPKTKKNISTSLRTVSRCSYIKSLIFLQARNDNAEQMFCIVKRGSSLLWKAGHLNTGTLFSWQDRDQTSEVTVYHLPKWTNVREEGENIPLEKKRTDGNNTFVYFKQEDKKAYT